jgi:hypothetical protein
VRGQASGQSSREAKMSSACICPWIFRKLDFRCPRTGAGQGSARGIHRLDVVGPMTEGFTFRATAILDLWLLKALGLQTYARVLNSLAGLTILLISFASALYALGVIFPFGKHAFPKCNVAGFAVTAASRDILFQSKMHYNNNLADKVAVRHNLSLVSNQILQIGLCGSV